MKLLCISFGNSNRINSFIDYIKSKYSSADIETYNVFNESNFNKLSSKATQSYDGIFLLSTGSEKGLFESFSSKQSKYKDKCSVKCLKEEYPEKYQLIIDIIYNNMLTPILAVCYGAEILNLFYNGTYYSNGVRNQALFKTRLDLTCPLFKGVDRIIYPQYNHYYISKNEVSKPIAFNLSDFSQSAYQHSKYHYGFAFHLVNSDPECLKIIDNFIDIIQQKKRAVYIYILLICFLATMILKYFYKFKNANYVLIVLLFLVCVEMLFH